MTEGTSRRKLQVNQCDETFLAAHAVSTVSSYVCCTVRPVIPDVSFFGHEGPLLADSV
jgi:hypothetical protein